MISLIWNVRGIGGIDTQKQVWYYRNSLKLNVLAILEPMVPLDEFKFCTKFKMEKVVANCANKIWLFSDSNYDIEVLEDNEQFLHCRITSSQLPGPILWTIIYAKCTRAERTVLWEDLRNLNISESPWMVGGDFNIIAAASEREGGAAPNFNAINDFGAFILDCGLNDAGFEGYPFTWKDPGIKQRLDRILVNHDWLDTFLSHKVIHGVSRNSDHKPLIFYSDVAVQHRKSQFRFQDMWFKHPDCLKVIENNWRIPARNSGMKKLWEKLQRLKQFLKWWNKHVFGNIFHKMKEKEEKVAFHELAYHDNPTAENLASFTQASSEFHYLLGVEEAYWKQQAHCNWIIGGDRNTKLFHNMVKRRRLKGKIQSIVQDWVVITKQEELQASAVKHFEHLLSNNISLIEAPALRNIPKIINDDINMELCECPRMEELKAVVFSLNKEASAGPDGYTSRFFQCCWDFIKEDLLDAVADFFAGGTLPIGFSATSIVLIPKVPYPGQWSEFRPISLCNFTHKIITKLINDRLAMVLPLLISENQSGFIKVRLISDNILLLKSWFIL